MSVSQRAFERLEAANPLLDTAPYEPTQADAATFLRGIEEGTMDTQQTMKRPTAPQRPPRRWPIAVAAFVVVLAVGAAVMFTAGGNDSQSPPVASTPTTTEAPPADVVIEEPAALAEIRAAVNRGDVDAAVSAHDGEASCDRFFTTGVETCADWYTFLVGIGTYASVDCEGRLGCKWIVESDAHRALGIDSVRWEFTGVGVDGWSSVVPDGNLFTGIPGEAALDDEFWDFVSAELVRQDPELSEVVASSNRVPATLNSDLAAVVLGAARTFGES